MKLFRARVLLVALAFTILLTQWVAAQSGQETGPSLQEGFNFRFDPRRERALGQTVEALMQYDQAQRARDLDAANAGVFSRAIDLFRFVPFKLGNSSGNMDDFLTPNYLRPDYVRVSETNLFE